MVCTTGESFQISYQLTMTPPVYGCEVQLSRRRFCIVFFLYITPSKYLKIYRSKLDFFGYEKILRAIVAVVKTAGFLNSLLEVQGHRRTFRASCCSNINLDSARTVIKTIFDKCGVTFNLMEHVLICICWQFRYS